MLVTSWLTSENVVIICSPTHINVSDVPESDVFHVWFDVSEVSEVHLDDSGDVHALHQHVQDDVGHRQLKPESTDLGHVFQLYWDFLTCELLACPLAPDLKVMFVSMMEVSMVKIGLPESSE